MFVNRYHTILVWISDIATYLFRMRSKAWKKPQLYRFCCDTPEVQISLASHTFSNFLQRLNSPIREGTPEFPKCRIKQSEATHYLALIVSFEAISATGFEIHCQTWTSIKEGEALTLMCEADTYWEWSTFKAPTGKICNYVWTKAGLGNGGWKR